MHQQIDMTEAKEFEVIKRGEPDEPQQMYLITDPIPLGADIDIRGNITINSDIPDDVKVHATGDVIINSKNVGKNCSFTSDHGDIKASKFGDENTVHSGKDIRFQSAGDKLTATAKGKIYFKSQCGKEARLKGASVEGLGVGENSEITSTKEEVNIPVIDEGSKVYSAGETITASRVGATFGSYAEDLTPSNKAKKIIYLDTVQARRVYVDSKQKKFLIPETVDQSKNQEHLIDLLMELKGRGIDYTQSQFFDGNDKAHLYFKITPGEKSFYTVNSLIQQFEAATKSESRIEL